MVTDTLAEHFTRRGIPLITKDAGARAFLRETGVDGPVRVLIDAGPGRDIVVDTRTHPYLADHAPAGTPVLPLALAAEWLMAGTTGLADLRVLRKVEVPARLTIETGPRLVGADGHTHYQAHRTKPGAPTAWHPPTGPPVEDVYGHPALFHGPACQALRRIDALSADGAAASVVGVRGLGWPGGPWWTDPAAVDGALQAAVVWAHRATGDVTLPMAVGELRLYRTGPAPGPLRCLVRAGDLADGQSTCDIALIDADGQPRTELLGVTLIRRPDVTVA